uniref:Uncharacterized protein n=1 Tax=Arundo donax TaxID=35708 RepID=A0A0A8ZBB6_ARUDO
MFLTNNVLDGCSPYGCSPATVPTVLVRPKGLITLPLTPSPILELPKLAVTVSTGSKSISMPPPLPNTSNSSNSSVLFVCPAGSISSVIPAKSSSSSGNRSFICRRSKSNLKSFSSGSSSSTFILADESSINGVPCSESGKFNFS